MSDDTQTAAERLQAFVDGKLPLDVLTELNPYVRMLLADRETLTERFEELAQTARVTIALCKTAQADRELLEAELTRQHEIWTMQSKIIRALAAEVPDDVRERVLASLREQGTDRGTV